MCVREFLVFFPWYCVDCPFVVVKVNGDEWGVIVAVVPVGVFDRVPLLAVR